ncbi:unnamed protein product [Chrysodeixis includens]|uniref:Uncharacterized protein n=1 Tax=Chrysodeixis includens TaxID=689277 RepID=A0A9N8KV09_CHRIL|nr:unnamed protein product [Chrysodeixis includens]
MMYLIMKEVLGLYVRSTTSCFLLLYVRLESYVSSQCHKHRSSSYYIDNFFFTIIPRSIKMFILYIFTAQGYMYVFMKCKKNNCYENLFFIKKLSNLILNTSLVSRNINRYS